MPPYIAPEENAVIGYWGPPSSTLDWCEENHAWSPYVAEFWNTISNLAMILPGAIGTWRSIYGGLELRYILSYFGLFMVGVGSTLFHGTLSYSMQLLDELPMLICCSFILFSLYEMDHHGNWSTRSYLTATTLIIYTTLVSIVYIVINDPTFHEVTYSVMVLAIIVQGFYCVKCYSTSGVMTYAIVSVVLYMLGFALWNIDNAFCPKLRHFRHTSPLALLGPLSQFHSWWHVLAGMGTYLHVLLSSQLRTTQLQRETNIKFQFGFPLLEISKAPVKKE